MVALTASPAGEKTVHETVIRIEELLDRLGADLAAPADTLQEVGCAGILLMFGCEGRMIRGVGRGVDVVSVEL